MIGKNAGNCLYNQRQYFDKVMQLREPHEKSKSTHAKSNTLLNNEECDVVSLFEENIHEKTVKEKHRLESLNRKFAQCYMQSAWKDFEFVNSLRTNNVLSKSNQNAKSFDIINQEVNDCVEKTKIMIVIAKNFHDFMAGGKTDKNLIVLTARENPSSFNAFSFAGLFSGTIACPLPPLHLHKSNVPGPETNGEGKQNQQISLAISNAS